MTQANKKPTDRAQGLENPWEETKHSGTASGIRAASRVENGMGGQAPVHRMRALTQHIHSEGPTHEKLTRSHRTYLRPERERDGAGDHHLRTCTHDSTRASTCFLGTPTHRERVRDSNFACRLCFRTDRSGIRARCSATVIQVSPIKPMGEGRISFNSSNQQAFSGAGIGSGPLNSPALEIGRAHV